MRLIVGLGNPGREYRLTRHNVGFDAVDRLAERLTVEAKKKKFGGLFAECSYEGAPLLLLKPQQYMNLSGRSVADAAGFYRISPDRIIVVLDDMALPCGSIRLRASGSAGGHNGLADVIEALGSQNVARLRIGIGSRGDVQGRDYVLSRPDPEQRALIDKAVAEAVEAILCWIAQGIDAAMTKCNTPRNPGEQKDI